MMAVIAEMMIFANAAVAHRIVGAFPGAALLRRHPAPRAEAFDQVCICTCPLRLAAALALQILLVLCETHETSVHCI